MTESTEVRGVTFKACECGCNQPVSSKATYRPGHDARHAGKVGRAAADKVLSGQYDSLQHPELFDSLATDALQYKAQRVAANTVAKVNARDVKKMAKDQARAAKSTSNGAQADEPQFDAADNSGELKVGRWTYPTRMTTKGKAQRNSKTDGSGEWTDLDAEQAGKVVWSF